MKATPKSKKKSAPVIASTPSVIETAAAAPAEDPRRFAKQYGHWLPRVAALEALSLEHFANDPQVVLTNVRKAVASLRPHEAELRKDPTVPWDAVFELEGLTEGFVYSTLHSAESTAVTREDIDRTRAELQALREPALLIGRGLALLGYLPLDRIEAIEAGTGTIDMGRDGIALAILYRKHASKIANKHPFTEAQLARMESLGEWILDHVKPDGAHADETPNPQEKAVTETVDRFWTEILARHRHAETGGFKLWNKRFGEYVPPLLSRPAVPRSKAPADPPA